MYQMRPQVELGGGRLASGPAVAAVWRLPAGDPGACWPFCTKCKSCDGRRRLTGSQPRLPAVQPDR